MSEFLSAALSFPTALFTFGLLVVAGYWLLVLCGAFGVDALDGDTGAETELPATGLDRLGLGGVPATVAITGLIAVSWFVSLVGAVVIETTGAAGVIATGAGFATLVVAVVLAVAVTRVIVIPLRGLFRETAPPSRQDFIGRVCVVRTGHIDSEFGQAELTADDGSSAIIQVRQAAEHAATAPLTQGDSAVVYDYDPATATFWVASTEGY